VSCGSNLTVDTAREVRFYMATRFVGSIAGWEWDGENWRKCRAVDSLMVSLGTSRDRGGIGTISYTNYAPRYSAATESPR
jgi:hypothetical protein